MKVKISEARFNDAAYMCLKYLYFMPAMNSGPRNCDVRMVMLLAAPEMVKDVSDCIMEPDEAPKSSHDIFYEVDTDEIYNSTITYLEDHWIKDDIETVFPNQNFKEVSKKWWDDQAVSAIMMTLEKDCGPQEGQ